MKKKNVIRESNFEEYGEAKVDSKNRITLGRTCSGKVSCYKIYRNSMGQIVLDPHVSIPAHEAWLYQNKDAFEKVKKGLSQLKAGKVYPAKEDYTKYIDGKD